MDLSQSSSIKRCRETRDEEDALEMPPRKRTASSSDQDSNSPYQIAERLASRYVNDVSGDRDGPEPRYTRTTRSVRPPSSAPSTLPPKPTALHYRPALILHGHKKGVSCVKFSPDGKWIASSSADCTIKIWDAHTGQLEHTLQGHLAGISTISWSPDSRILASGSDDKSIRLWDVETGLAHPKPFNGHHNYVFSIAFSPKGNMLVSGSFDEAVFLWDVRAARIMRSLPAHSDPIGGIDFVRDGTLIVSCANDGLIRVWEIGRAHV